VALDYVSIISDQASRLVDAYESDPEAPIPWSDRWKVGTVVRHVAGTHHVVAEIVRGRPDTDFGFFNELQTPGKGSPDFVDWFRAGTASLAEQLSTVPADAECWSWYPSGGRVGWWARRMAFEAVVHRWDTDAAQGHAFLVTPDVAADGVDEYLDVFVATSRAGASAPPGPTIEFECSDRTDRWWLDLSIPGERTLTVDPRETSLRIRGTAQELLLFLWGRVPISDAADVELLGDTGALDRWAELIPPM
jgi:uncharacterized protein (TIGR03083 family)